MSYQYILDGKKPIPCDDIKTWARWFEGADRHVAKTEIGNSKVSTVFLGLDHNFCDGKPLLFETMTFPDCEIQERYSTWDEAEAGHNRIVQMLKLTEGK